MVKDYTDFIIWIFDSKERVYHARHIRNFNGKNFKGEEYDKKPYHYNGHNYHLNLDRAYRFKWAMWKKWNPKVYGYFGSIKELVRSKKIGILLYQEPKDSLHGIEIPIEPLHVSRIHQPTGVMKE